MALRSLFDVPAPAKLNLFLHVIGRRSDGYHLLQSVFTLIDWCDTLHFELRADGALHRHDLGPPLPADDLCLRAAGTLQRASGTGLGADISIDKRLPWGAGLGGGSSDAASTLLALNRLWRLNWPRERLLGLAATIGADVPFFVGGHNAFVEGIGEQLTPVDLAPARFAVVKPAAAIATADVFASPDLVRNTEPAIISRFLADTQMPAARPVKMALREQHSTADEGPAGTTSDGTWRNNLQPVAETICPDITLVCRWLEQRFGNSRMSGSGSAVFARAGTFDQPVATFGPKDFPEGWVGRMCCSWREHPLLGWAD